MVGLGQFSFSLILELISGVLEKGVEYGALSFFQRRRIERRVEDATAEVVEPLLPFLSQEGIPEDKQYRLIQACVDELRPLTEAPAPLFEGSLNGQKIFEDLYADRDLPEVVLEDDLSDIYSLLCPRIATLLCRIPALVKDWENEAWTENFRRFDELTNQLRSLFSKVDELAESPAAEADSTLTMVRRALAQRIRLELDLTGLRADRPLAGKFDDFFVHPQLLETLDRDAEERESRVIGEPSEAFSQFATDGSHTVVIGAPGAGKSTWTKWLQREALSPRWMGVGIRVELRRFSTESPPSLHELLREAAGKHLAEELTAKRIGKWLKASRVVFILDGFDELQPSEREYVYDWIVQLVATAPECPVVLTSRPLTTDHLDRLGTDWERWSIGPFDQERIVEYIGLWYTHTPLLVDADRGVDAANLAAAWRADPTIGPLTGNPLLLSTLLLVHHLDGSLPAGRSQLYRRYVEGMLGVWDDRRHVIATPIPLGLTQKLQIVRGVALHMFLLGKDQLDEPAMLELVAGLLDQIDASLTGDAVLAALRERSGLIVGPGIYGFAHKSVAEYLVAEAVLQGDNRDPSGRRIDRFWLFEHRDDDRWNTVTFLWAGLAPMADVESFIEACMDAHSWALGYGVLADQYERIPRQTRRRLLLRALSREWSPSVVRRDGFFWVTSFPSAMDVELSIPTFRLRGLAPDPHFHRLLNRALSDSTIEWSDGVNAGEAMRDLLWMVSLLEARDVEELKERLASECPDGAPPAHWQFWALQSACFRAGVELAPDLEVVLETFRESCPEARGLVPIALICAALALSTEERDDLNAREGIARIVQLLPGSDEGEIQPDWLLGTRDWILGLGGRFREQVGDLFAVFLEGMDQWATEGLLERGEAYERAKEYVKGLQELRENL